MNQIVVMSVLEKFFIIIWGFLNYHIIEFEGGFYITFINIFGFCFVTWAIRNFIKILLDRRNGEV